MDRLHVVGDPGDDLAHRGEIKKAHGEALDVLKELPAHGVDDLLASLLQQQELGPVAHKQDRQYGHILPRCGQYAHEPLLHRLPGGVAPIDEEINGVAGEDGLVELQRRDSQRQNQTRRHGCHVGPQVGEHPHHGVATVVDVLLCLFEKQLHASSPPSSRSCFSSCCLSWMLR